MWILIDGVVFLIVKLFGGYVEVVCCSLFEVVF